MLFHLVANWKIKKKSVWPYSFLNLMLHMSVIVLAQFILENANRSFFDVIRKNAHGWHLVLGFCHWKHPLHIYRDRALVRLLVNKLIHISVIHNHFRRRFLCAKCGTTPTFLLWIDMKKRSCEKFILYDDEIVFFLPILRIRVPIVNNEILELPISPPPVQNREPEFFNF